MDALVGEVQCHTSQYEHLKLTVSTIIILPQQPHPFTAHKKKQQPMATTTPFSPPPPRSLHLQNPQYCSLSATGTPMHVFQAQPHLGHAFLKCCLDKGGCDQWLQHCPNVTNTCHTMGEYTSTLGPGGKLFSYLLPAPSPISSIFCLRVGDLLLFDNGYFDASYALGIWFIWIFTHFHLFGHICAHFPHLHSFLG